MTDIQTHNGVSYYRSNQHGYFRSGPEGGNKRLQRVIYSEVYGNIPHGWDVHHRDNNKANNVIDNLEALPRATHLKMHPKNPKKHPRAFTCEMCSTLFVAVHSGTNRFCSGRCRSRWHYVQGKTAS